jgi:hypothetical protein
VGSSQSISKGQISNFAFFAATCKQKNVIDDDRYGNAATYLEYARHPQSSGYAIIRMPRHRAHIMREQHPSFLSGPR